MSVITDRHNWSSARLQLSAPLSTQSSDSDRHDWSLIKLGQVSPTPACRPPSIRKSYKLLSSIFSYWVLVLLKLLGHFYADVSTLEVPQFLLLLSLTILNVANTSILQSQFSRHSSSHSFIRVGPLIS